MPSVLEPSIQKLNRDIRLFPQVKPITPDMKITFKGVSRTVMLDRYAFKDTKKTTLEAGDLVVFTYKEHPKYPSRGYGIVLEIDRERNEVTAQLDEQFEDGKVMTVSLDKVDKPLELYYEQIAWRNATGIAIVEAPENFEEVRDLYYSELVELNFIPAGRVLMGAGSGMDITYFNCYVMPFIHDSRGGIAEHRKKVMEIMSRGGGVGTNGSTLRPRDTYCHGVSGHSSGSVTWLHDLSELTLLVSQGGSRRGAQMIMLNSWHSDIVEFIISKMQNPKILRFIIENTESKLIRQEAERKLKFTPLTKNERSRLQAAKVWYEDGLSQLSKEEYAAYKETVEILQDGGYYSVNNPDFLTGANISVNVDDEFMAAVESDDYYNLRYPDIENYDEDMRKVYDEEWHKIGDVREWEAMGYGVKVYHRIKAKDLWDLINTCATYSAEPGIFFIDTANQMTNAVAYNQKVVATNPCGKRLKLFKLASR